MRHLNIVVTLLVANSMAFTCLAGSTDTEVKILNQETEKHLQEHNYTKALASYDKTLTLDPNNIKALHKHVVIYMLMNKPDSARADLKKLITLAKTPADKHAA